MSVKLYIMTHKPFSPPEDPMYLPLHVGRANAKDLGFLGDDTGDSISSFNPYFSELTGMYWLWKNCHAPDFIGICHYRRYLLNEQGRIFTEPQLKRLLLEYDIVTTKLLTLPCPYMKGFSENHSQKDLLTTGEVLTEKYPAYAKEFQQLVHGPHTYFGNMLITSKELFDRYCAWLFDILFEVGRRTDLSGYNDYEKRLFGFLSELLQTVWIRHNRLRVKECMVGMVGEKYETKKLKEQMALYFEKRDYNGAKDCFLSCYAKRPDVLMEASDVTGELRLLMQAVSTCSYEDALYHRCILDDLRGYDSLIRHFHQLNRAVMHFLAKQPDEGDIAFLKQSKAVTPVSVEIAAKLFSKEPASQQDAIQGICALLPPSPKTDTANEAPSP